MFLPTNIQQVKRLELLIFSSLQKLYPLKTSAEDVTNGAVSINGQRVTETDYVVSGKDRIEGQFTVIRRGKKKYFLIKY